VKSVINRDKDRFVSSVRGVRDAWCVSVGPSVRPVVCSFRRRRDVGVQKGRAR
jgi:hypothetical protein